MEKDTEKIILPCPCDMSKVDDQYKMIHRPDCPAYRQHQREKRRKRDVPTEL